MGLFEGKSGAERNKIIAVIVLGTLAVISLTYTFGPSLFSSGQTAQTTTSNESTPTPTPSDINAPETTEIRRLPKQSAIDIQNASIPIVFNGNGAFSVPVSGRNIFAFWEPGDPRPPRYVEPVVETPTPFVPLPTPDYKIILSFVNPQSAYAGAKQFRIEINGDKFTKSSRVVFNGAPLPTTFISEQRLSANVPAHLIARAYTGGVMVDVPDSDLFSRTVVFNVQDPPKPTVEYIGMIARQHYNNDTAYFRLKGATKENPTSARLNDVVEGRFRVISISAEEVEFEDTRLGFKHKLALLRPEPGTAIITGNSGYGPGTRRTPRRRRNIPGINNVRRRTPRPRTTRTPTTPRSVRRINPTDRKVDNDR
jgi:hypothetical protein